MDCWKEKGFSRGEETGGNHLDLLYACRKLPKNKTTPKHYGGKGTLNKCLGENTNHEKRPFAEDHLPRIPVCSPWCLSERAGGTQHACLSLHLCS